MKKRITFKQLLFEQQILGILLFSLLVVFLWVVSSIYFSYSASTLTQDDQIDVLPLDPTINDRPLRELNGRKWWTQEELADFPLSITVDDGSGKSVSSFATPVPTKAASSSATPSAQ